jgi:hypothetical protein
LDMERLRREVSAEKRKNMNVKLAAGESDEVPDELRCPISERCFAPPPVRKHSAEDRGRVGVHHGVVRLSSHWRLPRHAMVGCSTHRSRR